MRAFAAGVITCCPAPAALDDAVVPALAQACSSSIANPAPIDRFIVVLSWVRCVTLSSLGLAHRDRHRREKLSRGGRHGDPQRTSFGGRELEVIRLAIAHLLN